MLVSKKNIATIILTFMSFAVACQQPSAIVQQAEEKALFELYRDSLLAEYLQEVKTGNRYGEETGIKNEKLDSIDFGDVYPLLKENCISCHKPNGTAPFALTTYTSIKKRAPVIKQALQTKLMPPWAPDNAYAAFFNAPKMTDAERALIGRWIDKGCVKGDFDETQVLESKPSIRQPDLVLGRKEPHIISADGETYVCFVLDPELKTDKYLSGIEFLSDNPEMVHHRTLYIDTTGLLDDRDEYWACKGDGIDKALVSIQTWSKGMVPFIFNEELAYRIPAGSKFLLQSHYEGTKGRTEWTKINLFFVEKPATMIDFHILSKQDIVYPANEIVTETITYAVQDSISLLGLIPHLHDLGKKVECFAITPTQKRIKLMKIPDWSYYFQGQYIYPNPVMIPAGSTIYMNVVIDNTVDNPTQPNDPVRDVTFQQSSFDEMLVLVLIKTAYKKTDKHLQVASILYQ